jgi:hypothetical protein
LAEHARHPDKAGAGVLVSARNVIAAVTATIYLELIRI